MTNLAAMSLLALLVGLFLIYNSVSFSVLQRRALIGNLRALGVTEQQWRVLRALSGGLEWRLNELAEHTQISMPSLSRIVPVLIEKGLLLRRADDRDGRSSKVALTSNGQAFFDSGAEKSETIYRAIEDRFGRARMDALYQLLDELNACLARP